MIKEYNPLNLNGRRFLITGAASGIGRATSILLSRLGADLLLVDLNEIGLNETIEECKGKAVGLVLDLSKSECLYEKISFECLSFGRLDGLAHIAGKSSMVPLKAITQKICMDIFQINTYPAIELAKILANRNIFAGGSGSMVLVSSVYGLVGSSANIAYATSKAALHGVTKSLAIELAPKNIRVNCIAPGFVTTKMLEKESLSFNEEYSNTISRLHPLGLGKPEDIANSIVFLLSDMARWITGSVISVDGGFTAQ